MSNPGLPIILFAYDERINRTSGLPGVVTVDSATGEAARPSILRRLFRGIGDGTRARNTAADLRRIRL